MTRIFLSGVANHTGPTLHEEGRAVQKRCDDCNKVLPREYRGRRCDACAMKVRAARSAESLRKRREAAIVAEARLMGDCLGMDFEDDHKALIETVKILAEHRGKRGRV